MTQTEAFLLTLAIELPVAIGLATGLRWAPGSVLRLAASALAASALTHPILWIVDPLLGPAIATPVRWGLLESAIALVEAAVYRAGAGLPARRALAVSIAANAASFAVGLIVYASR